MKHAIALICLALASPLVAYSRCEWPVTSVDFPCYCGGYQLDGSWVYLKTTATDADLEYGSFITLTAIPENLNALLLEVEPSHRSGYDLGLTYFLPNSNESFRAGVFSLHAKDRDSKSITRLDQLIQNFLGASYSTAAARSEQKIDHIDFLYRIDGRVDGVLNLRCSAGLAYLSLRRNFEVNFADLVLNPTSSSLSGIERSRYWGVGPEVGVEFGLPLLRCFSFTGGLGVGVLFGKNKSEVSASSFRNFGASGFGSRHPSHPIVTTLNCDLGLSGWIPHPCGWGLAFEAGYQIRYYFKPISRIDPFNGFVNNPNTFPIATASNLGLAGPYLRIAFSEALYSSSCSSPVCCPFSGGWAERGATFEFTSLWLKPFPTHSDLVYAILRAPPEGQRRLQANPEFAWAGKYKLGYRFCPTADLRFSAFFFHDSADTATSATGAISSVNASGPAGVLFSASRSRVRYELDQYDGLLGKSMQLCSWFSMHSGVGLRYLRQDRALTNAYFGGAPATITQEKFPLLKSRYRGLGPLFAFEPAFGPMCDLELVGNLGVAFFVGESKATLDQDNFGSEGPSSNDLRTPESPLLAPMFEGSGGIRWNHGFGPCVRLALEGGYQYMAYYRTVRLLLPTFLTGLEQINSNLILQGPYLRARVGLSF